jgi:hypothetical protein
LQPLPDTHEGPEAATRFENAMRKILAVPRSEMLRREAEYQKQAALKPKRGPKRNVKPPLKSAR